MLELALKLHYEAFIVPDRSYESYKKIESNQKQEVLPRPVQSICKQDLKGHGDAHSVSQWPWILWW
eukprot:10553499-Ditylum_brightwellii.AAC.1